MKNVKRIIASVTLAIGVMFSMTSCKKDVEERLEGDWDYVWSFTTVVDGEQSETEKIEGKFTFKEDGTGKMTYKGESEVNDFEWYSQGNQSVTIIFDDEESEEGLSSVKWEVIENKRKSQKWESIISGSMSSLDGSSMNYSTTMKMDLKK